MACVGGKTLRPRRRGAAATKGKECAAVAGAEGTSWAANHASTYSDSASFGVHRPIVPQSSSSPRPRTRFERTGGGSDRDVSSRASSATPLHHARRVPSASPRSELASLYTARVGVTSWIRGQSEAMSLSSTERAVHREHQGRKGTAAP